MGRQQYLTRLALGRSAFEDEEIPGPVSSEDAPNDADHPRGYVQQYDSKGRPINPAIDAFNAELREAQNAVLELVGVVERKDHSARMDAVRFRYVRDKREQMLSEEDERGDLLSHLTMLVTGLSKIWVHAFIQRIQIGYYDPSRTMADIVLSECRSVSTGNFKMILATMFPAVGDAVLHYLVRVPLVITVEQTAGRMQKYVQHGRLSHKTTGRLYHAISAMFELLMFTIDVALLPIEYYSTVQRLGLTPLLSVFPAMKSFWPWNSGSFHQYGWKGTLIWITSPAFLILIHKVIHYDTDDEEIPILGLFTRYRYPDIDEDTTREAFYITRPVFRKDPVGWLIDKSWTLRTRFLRWTGWTIIARTTRRYREDKVPFDDDTVLTLSSQRQHQQHQALTTLPIHRSTALAHLPAKYLAKIIDSFFCRLLILPIESFMFRSIARSFFTYAPVPRRTDIDPQHIYQPFRSPLSQVLRSPTNPSSWNSLLTYTSRLGLALSLNATVDTILFFGVYRSTRHTGVTSFGWGRSSSPYGRTITNNNRSNGSLDSIASATA